MKIEELRLSDLRARIVEEGDCWMWTGNVANGLPRWTFDGKPNSARRVVWEAVHGPIEPGIQIGVRCENVLCVHPDCLVARTRSMASKEMVRTVHAAMRMAMTKRSKSRLSEESVREIRSSSKNSYQLADEYGICQTYAAGIKTGKYRRDYFSPFAGLGARA